MLQPIIFYMATLEQYYTGIIVLPKINAASEGTAVTVIFCVLLGIFGNSFMV